VFGLRVATGTVELLANVRRSKPGPGERAQLALVRGRAATAFLGDRSEPHHDVCCTCEGPLRALDTLPRCDVAEMAASTAAGRA